MNQRSSNTPATSKLLAVMTIQYLRDAHQMPD
jgi:hypothetical protein